MAHRHDRECHFLTRIEVKQCIDLLIRKAQQQPRWKSECCTHRQRVREQSPVVPAEMTIGARTILPCVAPIDSCIGDDERGLGYSRFVRSRVDDDLSKVACSQLPQPELRCAEVVHARGQIGQVLANQVQFNLIERPRAGRCAEERLTPGKFFTAGYPRREKEKLRNIIQRWQFLAFGPHPGARDRRQRGHSGLAKILRQPIHFEGRINFEEKRLILPIQKMGMNSNAEVGMLGAVVIFPGGIEIAVRHQHVIVFGSERRKGRAWILRAMEASTHLRLCHSERSEESAEPGSI